MISHKGQFMNTNVGYTSKMYNAKEFMRSGIPLFGLNMTVFHPNKMVNSGHRNPLDILEDTSTLCCPGS